MPLDKVVSQSPDSEIKNVTLKNMSQVLGDSGTQRYSGFFMEEPNTIFRDESRVDNIEEMRRSDGAIKAALNAIKTPILATKWDVQGEDEKIVEFVRENLFDMPDRSWKDFLRELLTFLDFGHSVFEQIYTKKDGKIYIQDLAPRIQRSIYKWKIGDGSFGVTQQILTDDTELITSEIPGYKLLVLTNDKEGDDVTGQPILRSAYKHYKYKDILYRIQGIASERYGVGIPVIYMPKDGGYGDEEKDKAEEMLKNLRSNEKAYMVIPWSKEEGEVSILTPNGNPQGQSIENAIAHHNKMILMSVLANFLALGTDSTGSFSLSKDQSSFFLKHVEDKAEYIREQITNQVIKKLVMINFGPNAEVPELVFTPLGDIDYKEYSETLKTLADAGLIQKSPEVKDHVHNTFKLPEYDDSIEEKEDDDTPDKNIPKQDDEDDSDELSQKKNFLYEKNFKLWRKLTPAEDKVQFQFLNEQFNDLQGQLEDEMIKVTAPAIDAYTQKVDKKLGADDIAAIGLLLLTIKGPIQKIISKSYSNAYDVGKRVASGELGVSPPPTPNKFKKIKTIQTKQLAAEYVDELTRAAKNTITNGLAVDASKTAIVSEVKKEMQDKASKMITNVSGTVIGQNVNRGRREAFVKNINLITKFQRSEVLDGNTCNMCLSLDKRVVEAGDPIAEMDMVHTHCRGLWVPIFASEEQPDNNPIPKTVIDSFDLLDGRPTVNGFKQLKKPIAKSNEDAQRIIKDKIK